MGLDRFVSGVRRRLWVDGPIHDRGERLTVFVRMQMPADVVECCAGFLHCCWRFGWLYAVQLHNRNPVVRGMSAPSERAVYGGGCAA